MNGFLLKFCVEVGHSLATKRLVSDGNPDYFVDFPGFITISRQHVKLHFTVCLSKLETDFDEFF